MFCTKILIIGITMGLTFFTSFPELMAQSQFIGAYEQNAEAESDHLTESLADGKATISNIAGTVKILKFGSDEWVPVNENDTLSEGDQIRTDSDASVDIVYDESSLNVAHIDQNTIAEFPSIEPTLVYLSDGSIFNSLEALPENQDYEVATDTAVNAIRGTKFLRTFDASNQTDDTVVSDGSVESYALKPDGSKTGLPVVIQKDNSFRLNPDILKTAAFHDIKPALISPKHRERIEKFSNHVEKGLERVAGSPEALKHRREEAKLNMAKPEFREKFVKHKNEMAKKRSEQSAQHIRPIDKWQEARKLNDEKGLSQSEPGTELGPKQQRSQGQGEIKHPGPKHQKHDGAKPEQLEQKKSEMDRQKPEDGPKEPGQYNREKPQTQGSGPQQGMSRPSGQKPGPQGGGARRPSGGAKPAGGRR